jgi:hypothetical protein
MSEEDQDKVVESSLKKERRFLDPSENSIEPSFLENDGLNPAEEYSREKARKDSKEIVEDDAETFDQLSSDKEQDTTEGEIVDTHTSD